MKVTKRSQVSCPLKVTLFFSAGIPLALLANTGSKIISQIVFPHGGQNCGGVHTYVHILGLADFCEKIKSSYPEIGDVGASVNGAS